MQTKEKLLLIIVLMGVTLLCRLGFWQLSRAKVKQQLLSQWEQTRDQTPIPLAHLLEKSIPSDNLRYRKVSIQTQLMNEYTILLDNKTNKGQAGYHVIVPAKLNEKQLILINRGWIPLGHSRQSLPAVLPVEGKITIEGYLDFAYRNPFTRQAIEINTLQWPLRMQWIDTTFLNKILGKNIHPMLVVLNEKSPFAFATPLQQKEWLNPERHWGYAFQWFSLAMTLMVLYLWNAKNILKRKKERHESNGLHQHPT